MHPVSSPCSPPPISASHSFHGMAKVHDDFARPPLAIDHVRFVGEAIVAVLAETVVQANDAADMVIVDYEALPAAVTAEAALEPTRRCCSKPTATTWRSPPPTRSTPTSSATPTSSCAAAT